MKTKAAPRRVVTPTRTMRHKISLEAPLLPVAEPQPFLARVLRLRSRIAPGK